MELFDALFPAGRPSTTRVVAFVGAGGKTTAMFDLARQARDRGLSVVITTTTAMFDPRHETDRGFDAFVLWEVGHPLPPPLQRPGSTVLACGFREKEKICGPTVEAIDALRGLADIVLVEADGSRGLPIKAPAAWEPAMPSSADIVVGCIGLDAFGRPADSHTVHRLTEFLGITSTKEGIPIGSEALARLVASPQGLFKSAPPDARHVVLLTKADLFDRGQQYRARAKMPDLPDFVFSSSRGKVENVGVGGGELDVGC